MKELLTILKEDLDTQRKIFGLLQKMTKLMEDKVKNVYAIEKSLSEMEKLVKKMRESEIKKKLQEFIEKEGEKLRSLKNELKLKLFTQLKEKLQKGGLNLKGQYPNLYCGIFTLKIDFERGAVRLLIGPEEVSKLQLNPDNVADYILKYMKELKEREFDASKFYNLLRQAYRRYVLLNNMQDGDRAPIVGVYNEFVLLNQPKSFFIEPKRENFKPYPRLFFAYDLYRLRRTQFKDKINLIVATLQATSDQTKYMYIFDTEESGTRYSYIIVR